MQSPQFAVGAFIEILEERRGSTPSIELTLLFAAHAWCFDCHRERHRCPCGSGGGDELILAVGEATFEVGLEPDRAGLDVPGTVGVLGSQEVLNTLLINRVRGWHLPGGVEGIKRLS